MLYGIMPLASEGASPTTSPWHPTQYFYNASPALLAVLAIAAMPGVSVLLLIQFRNTPRSPKTQPAPLRNNNYNYNSTELPKPNCASPPCGAPEDPPDGRQAKSSTEATCQPAATTSL